MRKERRPLYRRRPVRRRPQEPPPRPIPARRPERTPFAHPPDTGKPRRLPHPKHQRVRLRVRLHRLHIGQPVPDACERHARHHLARAAQGIHRAGSRARGHRIELAGQDVIEICARRAGRHRPPEQGEHPHNGCSPCFLPRCSGIPRNRISNSAPTFEGLFEVFCRAVLGPFRAPARTKPLRRSFAGLCWALFAPLPERSPCEGLSEVFRWALGGHA